MKILFALFTLFLLEQNAIVLGIEQQSQHDIIFPKVDQYDECFIDESKQIRGICKNLSECDKALELWQQQKIRPQTCYFNKFEQFVCCENEKSENYKNADLKMPKSLRRSEAACEQFSRPILVRPIVFGQPTKPNEFPYMAALGWRTTLNNQTTTYRCGGALISSKFVLTAAHCMDIEDDDPYTVRLGGVNLTDPYGQNVAIKRIIVHPDYNISASYNDIALIELADDVDNTPICIWSEQEVEHNNVTAIGYGHTKFGGISSDQLLKTNLLLVSNDICQNYYAPDDNFLSLGLAKTQICARDPEELRDTCQGDSGGPIISKVVRFEVTASYVVGLTSIGQGCAGGPPSIYTKTSSYIDWIENIVWPVSETENS